MKIGELFFEIGAKTGKFQADLKSAQASTLAFGAGVVGTGYALEKMFTSSARTGTMLYNLSQQSGIASQKLDQLSIAANMTNAAVSTEEAAQSFAKLNQVLLSVQRGGANPFQSSAWLIATGYQGINVAGKNTLEVAENLRQIIGRLRPDMAAAALSASGIFKPEMVDFFSLSKDKFNTLGEAVAISDDKVANLKEADAAIASISKSFGRIKDNAMAGLAPTLTAVAKSVENATNNEAVDEAAAAELDRQKRWNDRRAAAGMPPVNFNKDMFGRDLPTATTSPAGSKSGKRADDFNAGNLRGANGEFRTFNSTEEGKAALISDLTAKLSGSSKAMQDKFGKRYDATLEKLITVFAPPNENDTQGYINYVAKRTGINPKQSLSADYAAIIAPAMIEMEKGKAGAEKFNNVTMTNNFTINGSNASAISDAVLDKQQQSLKQAQASLMVNY